MSVSEEVRVEDAGRPIAWRDLREVPFRAWRQLRALSNPKA